jgi:anti-sigma B factor antagonist
MMRASMVNISLRTIGNVTVLDLEGRMTVERESPDKVLSGVVRGLLEQGRNQVVLNLARVTHLDTLGLSEIVEAYLVTSRRGGALKLEHLSAHIQTLLRTTRLSAVLQAFESEAEAVTSCAKEPLH